MLYRISRRDSNYLQNNLIASVYPQNSIADGGGSFVATLAYGVDLPMVLP